MKYDARACQFNMGTGCVELLLRDGRTDPQDAKNAIVEIRGGTGGDEAAIFAGDLLRMYTKYIESKGWRYEITSF